MNLRCYALAFLASICLLTSCKEEPLENTLLWKIEGEGLSEPSYLFGTIHISCDVNLSEKIQEALDNTSRLVLEVDMDDLPQDMDFAKYREIPNGKTLQDFFTQDDYKKVSDFYNQYYKIDLAQYSTINPVLLTSEVIHTLLDCTPESYELELMRNAELNQEELLGLETVDFQMELLANTNIQELADSMVDAVDMGWEANEAVMDSLYWLYEQENVSGLYQLMNTSFDLSYGLSQEDLLDKRNQDWIPKITALVEEQPTFIGVGAGHLGGDQGVVRLLRRAGFTLTPVMD